MALPAARNVCLSLAVGLLLACLSGCGTSSTGSQTHPDSKGTQTTSPSTARGGVINSMRWDQTFHRQQEADKVLTLAKYERIKPGMTYEELIAILEIPPGPLRPDDNMPWVGPDSPVELTWFGPNKQRLITIKLKGKTVVEKSQTGLQ